MNASLEFSKTVARLKLPETEICVDKPKCGPDQILSDNVNIVSETLPIVNGPEILPLISEEKKEPAYTWKIAGFTTCTASCLGGMFFNINTNVYKDSIQDSRNQLLYVLKIRRKLLLPHISVTQAKD